MKSGHRRNRVRRRIKTFGINTKRYFPDDIHKIILEYMFELILDMLHCDEYINFFNLESYKFHNIFMIYNDPNKCPNNAKYIVTSDKFNKNIMQLPPKLIYIRFGKKFNQIISHWPASIMYIKFEKEYDKPLYNLPISLIEIHVYIYYKYYDDLEKLVDDVKTNKIKYAPRGIIAENYDDIKNVYKQYYNQLYERTINKIVKKWNTFDMHRNVYIDIFIGSFLGQQYRLNNIVSMNEFYHNLIDQSYLSKSETIFLHDMINSNYKSSCVSNWINIHRWIPGIQKHPLGHSMLQCLQHTIHIGIDVYNT
jgi:hypothetical protein